MYKRILEKPDGRDLILYSRSHISSDIEATSPTGTRTPPNAHLRWHPLRAEWVAYASHRQHRTFLPPPEYNPLAPTTDPAHPTELPSGDYEVAVFENLFPTLTEAAHDPPRLITETRPGKGVCEVVVFTQDPETSLGRLPLRHLELIIEVWGDRYRALGEKDDVAYVFPFENRGVEVGVTLHHPHGQIYAYPFVPPVPARELEQQRTYLEKNVRGLWKITSRPNWRMPGVRCMSATRSSPSCRSAPATHTKSGSHQDEPCPRLRICNRRLARTLRGR